MDDWAGIVLIATSIIGMFLWCVILIYFQYTLDKEVRRLSLKDGDREIDRILAMTEEELRAEFLARGEDPDLAIAIVEAAAARALNRVN